MAEGFAIEVEVRWADLDVNWHLKNTAYVEFAIHARLTFLARYGMNPQRLQELGLGPVVFREEMRYLREARFGQKLRVSFRLSGVSDDGSHWEVHHDLDHQDGTPSARIRVEGAWFDVARRRLARPPEELRVLLAEKLLRTDDFRTLPSVIKD